MAQIVEELILYDKFTNVFASYTRRTEQASKATHAAQGAVDKFTESQKMAERATSQFTNTIHKLVGSYTGLQGLKKLVNLSDVYTQTTARLDMMNDGLQTTSELNDMIFRSAMRSRGAYQQTADMVAKLGTMAGDAFSSSAEIVAFAEQINKLMTLSGTSGAGRDAAMLQLTQAMSSGVLRGEELNSVLEQAPLIAQNIAEYMGVSTGEMRELASQGVITADVVKNAILGAAGETNKAFEQLPMTWEQVWTQMQNSVTKALEPVLIAINWLANNIEIIGPLVLGVGAAFAVFQIAANWTKIATIATTAYHAVVNFLSIGFGMLTGSTAAASAATFTYNSALLACPITWIVMGVLLLVAAFYAAVAAINKFTGKSISATGIIAGIFTALGAQIVNMFVIPLQNKFANFANFIGNFCNSPVAAVKILFLDMADTVLGYISKVAHAIEDLINAIPGMHVNITSGLDDLQDWVRKASQEIKDESEWTEYVKRWDYLDLGDAFDFGYNWIKNLLSGKDDGEGDPVVTEMSSDISKIAEDTKAINKSVNFAQEDIKLIVDMAERRFVNNVNLTTQAPVINIQGANTGNTREDRRSIADAVRSILVEETAAHSWQSYAVTN